MGFAIKEKEKMLSLRGVGNTVVERLEQIGFTSLEQLSEQETEVVTKQISQMMRSSCWHNSPQAKSAINAIIELAKNTS